ncbi:MAG: HlyD family secretion protein [Saprospiraceae bacterium]
MESKPTPKKRSPIFMIILLLFVGAGAWFGYKKYTYSLHHEETDDAQIGADISMVIPRISGYITDLRVDDNQYVKKGDTLIRLDNRDYKIKLEQAEAALITAKSNLNNTRYVTQAAKANTEASKSSLGTIEAQIDAAKVNVRRTAQDYARYSNLIKDHSITQQQFEMVAAAKESAEKQVAILEQQKLQAQQQTNAVSIQTEATAHQSDIAASTIRQREVDIDAARLNLEYTVITAPEDGLVSKINVLPGQLVQAGQSLFSIVHIDNTWVVANFKETQLNKMTEHQKVEILVDAFPNHKFEATVASFSPATGSTFALLPPDNASGNFVKVVQRLPVRIEFTNQNDSLIKRLRPGMNVDVDVHLD